MTGTVAVVGYRNRIDPPELGDCGDPDCRTIAVVSSDQLVGRDLLLVATYSTATIDTLRDHETVRVCGACDGRRLGAWLRGESALEAGVRGDE